MKGFAVSLGINGNCLEPEVVTGPDDTDRDFTTVSNKNFFHTTRNNLVPNSTGWALSMRISAIVPLMPDLTSFITFIASMMQTTVFSSTRSPTFTNAASSGE